ncbi:MAG: carboxypeptidase, partial [Candidatus Eisenbacteria bacterium]|nr:carboxypeptidase [Candidatus Eisenbacteria bacterium]
IRAVLEFVSAHPNIFGAITFHTFSRVILRPFSSKPDDEMDTTDLWVYQAIGERGTELTKYPCCSVNHDFRYHPKQVIGGAFDDWAYEHLGVFAFTIELWDLATASGITEKAEKKKFIEWFRIHPVEDDYKILDFVNENAPKALVPWREFDHPQLGKIEIGGWDWMYSWRNPPHALLEA